MTEINTLHPGVTAADHIIAAVGLDAANLALIALRADWLTADEAKSLEPVAVGLAYLLRTECPLHRGTRPTTNVTLATVKDVADAVAAYTRDKEES